MVLVSLPSTLYNRFDGGVAMISFVGLLVWVLGFYFETIGDIQMYIFKKNPANKGKVMDQGLWQYTRHPNYFGEILIWIGLYASGITLIFTNSVNPFYYLLLIISPVLMTTVLIKVSTPLLEKNMEKYASWEEYTKRVPMILPWGKK